MAKATCSVQDCNLNCSGQGFCRRHYDRWRKYGSPTFEMNWICEYSECAASFVRSHPASKYCRSLCRRRKFAALNKEQIREQANASYPKYKARILAYQREYYHGHSSEIIERSRAYYEKNSEAIGVAARQWTLDNPGVESAKIRERRALDPIPFRAKEMRRRALMRNASAVLFSASELDSRMAFYGYACWMCGGAFEHVDHVKPLSKNGPHMLSNLRPSCSACNLSKQAKWFGPSGLHRFMK